MKLGNLNFESVLENLGLVGKPTRKTIEKNKYENILVAEIDPNLSDTAAFCDKYAISSEHAVNCVIVEAKRGDKIWYAACMIPAPVRADINGIVRRELDARKISFAPMETAVTLSGMEYGAITPIGLPEDWPILVDEGAANLDQAIIGAGVRSSKLLVKGSLLAALPNAKVMQLTKD